MLPDLLALIESDQLAAEFYLVSDTDSLLRLITRKPVIAALEDRLAFDPTSAEALASRTMELFQAPVMPGYRSDYEPAICCYAYMLSRSTDENARRALNELDAHADPRYGWLRRLLDRCLQNASTNSSSTEPYAPPRSGLVLLGAATPVTVVHPGVAAVDDTTFDTLAEFWSSEDYLDLKAAA